MWWAIGFTISAAIVVFIIRFIHVATKNKSQCFLTAIFNDKGHIRFLV